MGAADCPFVAKKTQLSKMAAPKQCDGTPALEAVALMLAGTVAPMACTVLPPLLTALLWPRRPSSQRWLPLSSVMEPPALEDVAPMLAGTVALMACTVLPQLLTAHLWPRRPS